MTDIEDRLRGYRPAGPHADLRARIVEGAHGAAVRSPRRMLEWVPVFAAAAAALIFALMAQRAQADIASRLAGSAARRADAISALAGALGGSEMARVEAERIVSDAERSEWDVTTALDSQLEQGQ